MSQLPAAPGAQPAVPSDSAQTATPIATMGFGAREAADARRQSQFSEAADAPVDVNMNAAVARSQALTIDALGKSFAANEDLRQKYADKGFGKTATTV